MYKRVYRDPVTGDELTAAERVSWRLQGLIRNWYFIGAITLITITVWATWRVWTFDPLDIWNFCASYLALFIESIVGIAMFSQTKRDAVKIRHIEKIIESVAAIEEQLQHMISDECVVDRRTYDIVSRLDSKLNEAITK